MTVTITPVKVPGEDVVSEETITTDTNGNVINTRAVAYTKAQLQLNITNTTATLAKWQNYLAMITNAPS